MLTQVIKSFLKNDLFTLNRQSIVDIERYIQTGDIRKSDRLKEILLRPVPKKEEGMQFTTTELVESGEEKGWIRLLDEEVLERVFQYLEKEGKLNRTMLSVNISARTLSNSAPEIFSGKSFEDTLRHLLEKYSINVRQLCFEITERIPLRLDDRNSGTFSSIQAIRKQGIQIALDDYGKGSLDLDDLRMLRPDYVKIDGKFVGDAVNDEYCRKVIEFIVGLAKLTHSITIAEKVENIETLYYMRELGVDFAQGWFIERSIPLGV